MFYEEYHSRPHSGGESKTPGQWAEHFGRKVIDGLIGGEQSPEALGNYGRLAGSFARIALDDAAVVGGGR